jgi:outer membrane receptor for ferrienterochelin and colicin
MKPTLRTWAAAAVAFVLASPVVAQTVGGTVFGRVTDESDRPVAGAAVSARNVRTSQTRTAPSDAEGLFRLVELPVGAYEFTVSAPGFATEVRTGVQLQIGQQSALDFHLKVAAVAETVTVQAEAPIVETTKSAIGANVTTRQIDELPLPERNFENLIFLTPGITTNVTGEGTTISSSGSNGASNTFLIDGLSNDQDALGDTRGDYSPDAIGEFEVLSSQYDAQYGQASGAIINVLTRSGTNDLHGRVSGYYRDEALTASDPFAQKNPVTNEKEKTPFTQWIAGASLGGPIVKDKAFFFANWEQTWRDRTAVVAVDPALLESLGLPVETALANDLREPRVVAKLDFHLTSSQTLMGRFRLDNPKTTNEGVGDALTSGAVLTSETGFTLDTENTDYAVAHTWVASPTTLNEARFQYSRQFNDLLQQNCPGCPTIVRPSLVSGKLPNQPQTFGENRYQFMDTLNFNLFGPNHSFKAGVDYSHIDLDAFVPQNFDGLFQFTTDAPFNPDDPLTYPLVYQVGTGDPNFNLSNNIVAVFLQDQWSVLPNLTLNLGLRWDYEDQVYTKNDWQNFAPRIHFAWDPANDGQTAIRGGFGMYYDQVFLNVPLIATIFEPGRFDFQTILFPGYPNPLEGGQQIPIPLPPSISILDPNNTTPYKNVGSLGVQRQLTNDMAASLDLVYARAYHLLMLRDANAPIDVVDGVPVYPDPTIGIAYDIQTIGKSEYMAAQIGFQKRFGQNLGIQLAYTLASSKDDTDGHQYQPMNNYDPHGDWGPSSNDIRNTLNAGFDWSGPWGILVGSTVNFLSAPPYNIITGTDDNGDANLNDRPEGVDRNSARGSDLWTVNLRLAKTIPIEQTNLQVIVEAFNVFNHVNPTGYVGNLSSANFGEPTRTAEGAFGPRQIQFGLRFDF